MGDAKRIAKAKRELEELYSGIPDDSVNLTFQDLAEVRPPNHQKGRPSIDSKNNGNTIPVLDPIVEASPRREEVAPLNKLPSLDFSRGLEASARYNNNKINQKIHYQAHYLPHTHHLPNNSTTSVSMNQSPVPRPPPYSRSPLVGSGGGGSGGMMHTTTNNNNNMGYEDMSQMSGMSMVSMSGYQQDKGGRRRPGIPHSNICTVCSNYIYVLRHRCLVCGRVYCRQCVMIGMGEMAEGRKCIECLGRRFSQRYIGRAGQVGCCMGYPSLVKQQELKWAEKGPRGSGENRYGRSGMVSRSSRSPAPRTPTRAHHLNNPNNMSNPPSFVSNTQSPYGMGSPYSPYYSPTNHPLPF